MIYERVFDDLFSGCFGGNRGHVSIVSVGGTVNQCNEITQNNEYNTTNNYSTTNNTYNNYDFTDNGTYSTDNLLSGNSRSVIVPGRVSQRAFQLMNSVGTALGVEGLKSSMAVTSGSSFGKFCIENPLKGFSNGIVPDIIVCINFDELAQSPHIRMIRTVLLFMVFLIFVSSVFTVLRQY